MQTRKVILLLFSLSLIFATFCGCGAKAPIELSESEITMEMYDEVTLTPQLKGYSMSDIMWRSSDSTVAKVRGGVVNSLKVGNAVITAKVGDATASVNVSVTRNKVGRALMVDKNSLDLEVGQSEKITASFKESGKILTVPVLFESSNPKIAEVNGDGVVSAIKRGNVIVSAYVNYKGQRHYRDVEVRSKIISYRAGEIGFINTVAATADGSSIAAYAGNVADLGFNVDAKILDANLKAGKNSAVWFKGENSERLVFNVKFKNALNGNIYMHLGGYKKQITVSPDLVSGDNSILFYGANGKIASTLSTSEVYTVVIDLTKSGEGKMFGLEFGADSSLYISEALLCTYDYYKDTYVHEQPPEIPELGFIYAETLSGLNVGGEEIDGFDKYYMMSSSGTPDLWDNKIWNDRVIIGGIPITRYRTYQYYGFDVMLTDVNYRNLVFWTGGYNIQINVDGTIKREGNKPALPNEMFMYDSSGANLPLGTSLETNKRYTFKIFIQREDTENVAFGFSVNSLTASPAYIGNPFFSNI